MGPLSEDVLVDWIDGHLAPDQVREVARASGRPDLGERIGQMQRQREVLRSLPHAHAPGDLHDRVMAALERDVLLGIADGAGAQPVESRFRVHPAREGVLGRIGRTAGHRAPRLALAAGLLLLVGGLAYFGSVAWNSMNRPLARTQPDPIADSSGSTAPGDTAFATRETHAEISLTEQAGTHSTEIAVHSSLIDSNTAPTAPDALSDGAPGEVELASSGGRRVVPIEEVEQLAREGRVVIRVLARKPEELSRIESRLGKPDGQRAWSLTSQVPVALAAAVLPAPEDAPPRIGVMASAQQPRTMASLIGPYIGPAASMSVLTTTPDATLARVRGTFLVDVPLAPRALASMTNLFRNRLDAKVLFEELPEALAIPSPTSAREVAWWTLGPSQWVERVNVPLVVESR